MVKINRKGINERFIKMNDAWQQEAASAKFMNLSQPDLEAKKTVITDKEATRDDLRAQLRYVEEELDTLYSGLDDTMVNVRNGVSGDPAYGNDSPLYGAMGFVRKSERKSGLTRKKKPA